MTIPPEVVPIVDTLLAGIRGALADNVVGVYTRGSLALGGFDAATSDVDLLVVTKRPLSEDGFARLASFHERLLPDERNEYVRRYEISYVDEASIRRMGPGERRHPTVGSISDRLEWYEHRDNWVLERWAVREHGEALSGPDPKSLIDSVLAADIRAAVLSELRIRMDDWADDDGPAPDWLRHRGAQVFEVETVCRALHTLSTGELRTKAEAVEWARRSLPGDWQPLIAWSQTCRGDLTPDESHIRDVRAFALWAVAHAGSG